MYVSYTDLLSGAIHKRHPLWGGRRRRYALQQTLRFCNGCLIHFQSWRISLFPILALWGNKNWPPTMKVKKWPIFQEVRGAMGSKWSSLKAPGIQNPLSHPVLRLDEFPFPSIGPLGVIRIGPPSMKVNKLKFYGNKRGLKGCKWSSLKAPSTENPLSNSFLGL